MYRSTRETPRQELRRHESNRFASVISDRNTERRTAELEQALRDRACFLAAAGELESGVVPADEHIEGAERYLDRFGGNVPPTLKFSESEEFRRQETLVRRYLRELQRAVS